jgi:hypothetical protein
MGKVWGLVNIFNIMKILITESRLYTAFKGWMDSEISSGLYEWREDEDEDGDIILVDTNEGYGHMWLEKKSKELYVYNQLFTEIQSYFPLEVADLLELIGRYVGETFQIEGINTHKSGWSLNDEVGETFQIEGINTSLLSNKVWLLG